MQLESIDNICSSKHDITRNKNDNLNNNLPIPVTTILDISYDPNCKSYEINKEIFNDFHHYEVYDSNKKYILKPFEYDFGKGKHMYMYYKWRFWIKLYDHIEEYEYVVAVEYLSHLERSALSKYCKCYICTASWWNLLAYLMNRKDIGCLSQNSSNYNIFGVFMVQSNIDQARIAH